MPDWDRIEQIFLAASDLPADARALFLQRECSGDAALRHEVEALLAADARDIGFVQSVIGDVVRSVEGERRLGETTGQYKLIREIGRGGMGAVYLAERIDDEFQKKVAVKLVQRDLHGASLLLRFRRERQILASLEHPNIARLLDGGTTPEGVPFMVMEYVEGLPVDRYCRRHSLDTAARIELFLKICSAVEYAHRNLVVHRDLKPANILVTAEGAPKLLDFGIAKLLDESANDTGQLTRTGLMLLTPDYAAPEQVRGDAVTTATDVYQLGAVLYEMLADRRARATNDLTPVEMERAICETEPEPPGVDPDLDQIILMAMRQEPARRYGSVAEFSDDLQRYRDNQPVRARPDAVTYRVRKFLKRHRTGAVAAAVVAVTLVGGVAATIWQARIARLNEARAQQRFQQVRRLANVFLFDFDEKIRDLAGATAARELLVRTALEYLDSLGGDAADDPALMREIATAYEKVGDVQGFSSKANLGKTEDAEKSFLKAVALRERLAAAPGAGAADNLALAQSYLRLSDAQRQLRSAQAAAATLEKARVAAEHSLRAGPGDAQAYAAALGVYNTLSQRHFRRSENRQAIDRARQAVEVAAEWSRRFPGDQASLAEASAQGQLSRPLTYTGDLSGALQCLKRAASLRESVLARQPGNATLKRALLRDYIQLGHLYASPGSFHLDSPDDALAAYRTAARLAEELQHADASNLLARLDLDETYWSIGLLLRERDTRESIRLLTASLGLAERTFKEKPKSWTAMQNFAESQESLAQSLFAAGRRGEAFRLMNSALDYRREIAAHHVKQPGLRYALVSSLLAHSRMRMKAGQRKEAKKLLDEGAGIAAEIHPDKTSLIYVRDKAELYSLLAEWHDGGGEAGPSCDWRKRSLESWQVLAARGVDRRYVGPRLAQARVAAECR